MTQEELEKKAKDSYWDSDASGSMSAKSCYVIGYVAGAKEYEQSLFETNKAYQDLMNDYRELEKENERLKNLIEGLKCCANCDCWSYLLDGERDCPEADCNNRSHWRFRDRS